MRRVLYIAIILAFGGCGSAFSRTTTVRGTGGEAVGDDQRWVLRIENNNWLDAKVYLLPAYSSTGPRVATVTGLARRKVRVRRGVGNFRLRVEFLASSNVWVSDVWSTWEECLMLRIQSHIPATYIMPCF